MGDLRLSGAASGLDTSAIITQLMAIERRPITIFQNTQSKFQAKIDLFRQINTKLVALQRAADKVKIQSFNPAVAASAVSSDPTKVTGTVGAGAVSGTHSVTVTSLAQSQINGGGPFTAPDLSISANNANLSNMAVTGAAASGTQTYALTGIQHFKAEVDQGNANTSTSIGTRTGDLILTKADGSSVTIALTATENTRAKILAKIQAQSDPFGITATLNGSKLVFTGTDGGDFTITGTARTLARLGLNTASTSTGVVTANNTATVTAAARAQVTVDGVVKQSSGYFDSFSAADLGIAGVSFDIAASAGNNSTSSLTVTNTAGSLRITDTVAGTFQDVAIGAGMSITQVRDAINAANTGMTAAVVAGALQLTGTAGVAYTVADAGGGNALASQLGVATVLQPAATGSYSIDGGPAQTANSNHVTGALPGVDLDLLAAGSVTLTVTAGAGAVTAADEAAKKATLDAIKDLVTTFNDTLGFIKQSMSYNSTTKTAGALIGDSMAGTLQSGLTRMFADIVDDTAALRSAGAAGLMLQRDGSISLDEAQLKTSLETNASALKDLFTREDGLTYNDLNGALVKVNSTGRAAGAAGDGIANRLSAYVDMLVSNSSLYNMTDANGMRSRGALLNRVDSLTNQISDLDKRIEDYTNRLSAKETVLRAKFTAMEKAIAMLHNQGNYMSSQIYSLPSFSNSSGLQG